MFKDSREAAVCICLIELLTLMEKISKLNDLTPLTMFCYGPRIGQGVPSKIYHDERERDQV